MNKFGAQKKTITYFLVAVALVAVAVVLFFVLKTENGANAELVVYAKDISMADGESKKIEYEVNPSQAVVRFNIVDKDIAEIVNETVIAKEVGETEIIITARYEDSVFEKRVELTITKENPNKDEEIEEPSDEPSLPSDGDNSSDGDDDNTDFTNEEDFGVEILSNFNCEVDGRTIKLTPVCRAMISFTNLNEEKFSIYSAESNSENLEVSLLEAGQRTVMLEALSVGEYKISISFGEYSLTYKVIVE